MRRHSPDGLKASLLHRHVRYFHDSYYHSQLGRGSMDRTRSYNILRARPSPRNHDFPRAILKKRRRRRLRVTQYQVPARTQVLTSIGNTTVPSASCRNTSIKRCHAQDSTCLRRLTATVKSCRPVQTFPPPETLVLYTRRSGDCHTTRFVISHHASPSRTSATVQLAPALIFCKAREKNAAVWTI